MGTLLGHGEQDGVRAAHLGFVCVDDLVVVRAADLFFPFNRELEVHWQSAAYLDHGRCRR